MKFYFVEYIMTFLRVYIQPVQYSTFFANDKAVALPIPDAAPVTIAIFSLNIYMQIWFSLTLGMSDLCPSILHLSYGFNDEY